VKDVAGAERQPVVQAGHIVQQLPLDLAGHKAAVAVQPDLDLELVRQRDQRLVVGDDLVPGRVILAGREHHGGLRADGRHHLKVLAQVRKVLFRLCALGQIARRPGDHGTPLQPRPHDLILHGLDGLELEVSLVLKARHP